MSFNGTPKVIDACWKCQCEFKPLAWGQGNPLLWGTGRLAGIRYNIDPRVSKQGTLKAVRFPALIPHHQVQGLPGRHVNPSWRESKIVHDDLYFLIFEGTGAKNTQEDCQAFDRPQAPC